MILQKEGLPPRSRRILSRPPPDRTDRNWGCVSSGQFFFVPPTHERATSCCWGQVANCCNFASNMITITPAAIKPEVKPEVLVYKHASVNNVKLAMQQVQRMLGHGCCTLLSLLSSSLSFHSRAFSAGFRYHKNTCHCIASTITTVH